MGTIGKGFTLFALSLLMFMGTGVIGQPVEEADKTLSPFFFVKSDDPSLDQLPLKSTSTDVKVVAVIADVMVTQVYKNEGKKPLEAIYIFPASTRAAVYGMKMTIGKRTMIAKIQERGEARRQYEQAKREGKSASLLEQQRPNVFQMGIANILPGDVIQVELKYTELLVPTHGLYEFVYPTVVGPRYSNLLEAEAPPSAQWVENPYLLQGDSPTYTFGISVNLAACLPIQNITCSSHKVDIQYDGTSHAFIKLDPSEKNSGNRDFIVRYQLAGRKIESGILLFEGEKENFFLLMLQPPQRVSLRQIPPREYIFIVDVSGSMYGFPLDMSKKLLKDMIGNFRPVDKFNVLLFSGGASVMSEQSLPVTPENIRHAINLIDQEKGGGGTELLPALRRALSFPRSEGHSRTIVIATDGYVTVEEEAFDLIRKNLGNANMFTFGIGSGVNRYLIEGMARAGMGEPFVINRPDETREKAGKFRKMIESPVLTNVRINFGKFDAYDLEPMSIPDLFAERPVIVFGKWRGKPAGEIAIKGTNGSGPYVSKIEIGGVKPLRTNSSLQYLWARHRIAVLSDYNFLNQNAERIKEVTRLGLTYNLLTAYTSFGAIDSEVRVADGQPVTVKQPLPLPESVSDYAVGNRRFAKSTKRTAPPLACLGDFSVAEKSPMLEEYKSERPMQASIDLGEISATGRLSKEAIQRVVRTQIPSMETSYRSALKRRSDLKGEVVLQITVDPNGRVPKVSLVSSKINDQLLEQLIIQKMKELNFPSSGSSEKVIISLLLKLKAS